jgi:hypothetical protein
MPGCRDHLVAANVNLSKFMRRATQRERTTRLVGCLSLCSKEERTGLNATRVRSPERKGLPSASQKKLAHEHADRLIGSFFRQRLSLSFSRRSEALHQVTLVVVRKTTCLTVPSAPSVRPLFPPTCIVFVCFVAPHLPALTVALQTSLQYLSSVENSSKTLSSALQPVCPFDRLPSSKLTLHTALKSQDASLFRSQSAHARHVSLSSKRQKSCS